MARTEYSIVGITSAAHVLCHWSVLIVTGLLVTLQREFDLSEFWVTVLPLSGYVLMGVGAVPAGLITDRWGARPVLFVYFVATGFACAAAAMAPNAWVFSVALTVLGLAVSLYHPAGLALISHSVERPGHALGIHGVAGSIGLTGGSLGLWMASLGNWRAAYWVVAAIAIACALVLPFLTLDHRKAEQATAVDDPKGYRRGTSVVGILALLYLAMALSGFDYRALMTALPTYLTAEAAGVYAGIGGKPVVTIVFLVGGVGQYLGGRFCDRINPSHLYVSLVATSVPMALLLAWSGGIGVGGVAAAMGLALVHFGTQPAENVLIARYSPARLRSTSYGIKFLVTFGFGALGAPAVGFLWDRTGTLAWTFVLFSIVALVVSGIIFLVTRMPHADMRSERA